MQLNKATTLLLDWIGTKPPRDYKCPHAPRGSPRKWQRAPQRGQFITISGARRGKSLGGPYRLPPSLSHRERVSFKAARRAIAYAAQQ